MLPHVDTVLHDLKLMDPERHKKWTGVDNKRLLENFKKAYETYPDKTFIARRPLIPGVNDDEEDIRAALAFIRPHKNVVDFELLPYMRFGMGKYDMLGRIYELERFRAAHRRIAAAIAVHHRRRLRPRRSGELQTNNRL